MARPVDPLAQYRVKLRINGGYAYASTQPPYTDPETGKKKYRHIHWGTVDDNLKFDREQIFLWLIPKNAPASSFPKIGI